MSLRMLRRQNEERLNSPALAENPRDRRSRANTAGGEGVSPVAHSLREDYHCGLTRLVKPRALIDKSRLNEAVRKLQRTIFTEKVQYTQKSRPTVTIVPVNAEGGVLSLRSEAGQVALTPISLRELGIKESSLEDMIRSHSELLFPDDEEDFLIVGQQVSNAHRDRADLVGLLPSGRLVVVEVKRDADDIKVRKEALEWQAIRYAATIATIQSPEELVQKLYAPFLAKRSPGKDPRTLNEEALEEVKAFLHGDSGEAHFNEHQEIILVASEFDERTLAACSWLVKGGIPLRCVRVRPHRHEGTEVLLEVATILPPPTLEDWFVEIGDRRPSTSGRREVPNLRLKDLFEAGMIKAGDKLRIGKHTDQVGTFIDPETVDFDGQTLSPTQFGLKVTGWSAFSVYGSGVFVNDSRIQDLREKLAIQKGLRSSAGS